VDVASFYVKVQPDPEQRAFQLSYLALGITGDTGHQKAKVNIGYSASNAKSTEVAIHQKVFPIYTTKLERKTFSETYEKAHKEFLELIRMPIRLGYIEELDKKRADAERLKDFIDGRKLNVEILYGTKEVKAHQCKLLLLSNSDLNVHADQGVRRRLRVQHYTSHFKEEVGDDHEAHVYTLVNGYESRFDDPEYKNAYLQLLLPYIGKLAVPASARLAFEEIADDNDMFRHALEENFTITGDNNDFCTKAQFEDLFPTWKWQTILGELKRLGLSYDRSARPPNSGRSGLKGLVYGIREGTEEE
jgi:hypothetical protein